MGVWGRMLWESNMNFLEDIDTELEKILKVKEAQKDFESTKYKRKKLLKNTRKGYFEEKQKRKSDKKFGRRIKKQGRIIRKYRRCPKKYNVYINSTWWTKRKNLYYQSHKRECATCLSFKYITLHHVVYGNFGREKDEHLVPLCRGCHEEYHTKYGVKGNMVKHTSEFITEKRELLEFPKL